MVLCELFVSILAILGDPFGKLLPDQRINYVANILTRHLTNFFHFWETIYNFFVSKTKVKNMVHIKVFIVRYGDMSGLIAIYGL